MLESGTHRNLAAKVKVPEFLSPRVGLPTPACAWPLKFFSICLCGCWEFPTPKTTPGPPGSYKQILFTMDETKPHHNKAICSSAFLVAIGSTMPGSTFQPPKHHCRRLTSRDRPSNLEKLQQQLRSKLHIKKERLLCSLGGHATHEALQQDDCMSMEPKPI